MFIGNPIIKTPISNSLRHFEWITHLLEFFADSVHGWSRLKMPETMADEHFFLHMVAATDYPVFFGILLIPFVYNGVFKTCIITHTIYIYICIVHIRLRNYLRCTIIPSLLTSAIHGKKPHMAHHANWGRGFRRIGSWAPLRAARTKWRHVSSTRATRCPQTFPINGGF